jgi:hypothetical protein
MRHTHDRELLFNLFIRMYLQDVHIDVNANTRLYREINKPVIQLEGSVTTSLHMASTFKNIR